MKPNKKYYSLVLALWLGLCWVTPTAFSEDNHIDHGSMEHGEMNHSEMDHSGQSTSSGDEYRTDPGQETFVPVFLSFALLPPALCHGMKICIALS